MYKHELLYQPTLKFQALNEHAVKRGHSLLDQAKCYAIWTKDFLSNNKRRLCFEDVSHDINISSWS